MSTHDASEVREGALALLASEPELEAAWFEALDGGEVSEPLAVWLSSHPEAARELEELREVQAMLSAEASSRAPGAHFFESLHDDIMAGLDRAEQEVAAEVVELRGGEVAPAVESAGGGGWWAWLRAWLVDRPTLAYGLGMGLALVGIVLWTFASVEGGRGASDGDAGLVARAATSGEALPAALANLSVSEQEAVRALAAEIQIDVLDEDEEEGDELEWSGLVGEDLSTDEIDEIEDALRRAL